MNAAVADTSKSPHARLKAVGVEAVRLTDRFWAPRLRLNREVSIPAQYAEIERTGRLDNFRRASGRKPGPFRGIYFNDSDLYKWMEACAWHRAHGADRELEALLDAVIDDVVAAQEPNGYLNTYFMFDREGERWTDLAVKHELYTGGHLVQAAIAHARATGKRTFLDVATRWADHVASVFGPGKRAGTPGHPEVEMALVELYRQTGERRYLELVQFFIDQRGRGLVGGGVNLQDRTPLRESSEVVGHAVRQLYLLAGAADLVAETGEAALVEALERHWRNLTERRMYVTGGCGSRYEGEAFGEDFELPNDRAYAETCASIANIMWNWRMLLLTGEARFADLVELALYNGFLAGWSLDGRDYFYTNPLEHRGVGREASPGRGSNRRTSAMWDHCACCPPNVARMIASLPGYFYTVGDGAVWVHLFAATSADLDLPTGGRLTLEQETDYPWSGEVRFIVHLPAGQARRLNVALRVRIPSWAHSATLDGKEVQAGAYAEVRRTWADGDTVHLSLPMPIERIRAHPYVTNNRGRVALKRGPLVYCLEDADHPGASVLDIELPRDAPIEARREPDPLGGVTLLSAKALVSGRRGWTGALYRPLAPSTFQGEGGVRVVTGHSSRRAAPLTLPSPHRGEGGRQAVDLVAIPYYAWANRAPGAMQVWLAESAAAGAHGA